MQADCSVSTMQVPGVAEAVESAASPTLMPFPLLAKPKSYNAATFDLFEQAGNGEKPITIFTWLEVFRRSIKDFNKRSVADVSVHQARAKAEIFATDYEAILSTIEANVKKGSPNSRSFRSSKVDCVLLCRLREQCLRSAGFHDTFAVVKEQENQKALELLPAILRDLDSIEDAATKSESGVFAEQISGTSQVSKEETWEKILRGVFAGNIFDLGATASIKLFEEAGSSFLSTRASLTNRRCAVDNFGAAVQQLSNHQYKKALFFVDNAGSDVVLGMLPMARELIKQGTAVVIAANSLPSINDITAQELTELLKQAGQVDKLIGRSLQEGTLQVVESGSDLPVIDLSKVSPALATASKDVDLVVLEGMGRAIETNLDAELTCDKLNIGMIKHPEVAALLQGELYDCVCKFTPASKPCLV